MSERGMKIAIAASGLGHVARGMEAWAESLAVALHRRGMNVTLFRGAEPVKNDYDVVLPCIKRTSRLARLGNLLNRVGAWRIGLGSQAGIESFTYGIRLLWHLRKGYDVVHVQQGSLALFLHRAGKLGLLKCAVVFGNGQKAPPEFLCKFPFLHFLSPYGMKEITDHVEKGPDWRVIPNFVDTDFFSPGDKAAARKAVGLPEDALIILSVGLIEKHVKRMDHLIREVSEFASSASDSIHLAIAGSRHSESSEIECLGRSLLGSRFSIFFDLERERMLELYRSADIFVLCSPREALGMAIIEAMSCGVPAICHTFPVMEWVVGTGGACVDMTEPGRLASELKLFRYDPALRESAGLAARARVLDTFSADRVTSDIVDMYRRALSAHRAARSLAVSRANN